MPSRGGASACCKHAKGVSRRIPTSPGALVGIARHSFFRRTSAWLHGCKPAVARPVFRTHSDFGDTVICESPRSATSLMQMLLEEGVANVCRSFWCTLELQAKWQVYPITASSGMLCPLIRGECPLKSSWEHPSGLARRWRQNF
jgi:hypothetical protein